MRIFLALLLALNGFGQTITNQFSGQPVSAGMVLSAIPSAAISGGGGGGVPAFASLLSETYPAWVNTTTSYTFTVGANSPPGTRTVFLYTQSNVSLVTDSVTDNNGNSWRHDWRLNNCDGWSTSAAVTAGTVVTLTYSYPIYGWASAQFLTLSNAGAVSDTHLGDVYYKAVNSIWSYTFTTTNAAVALAVNYADYDSQPTPVQGKLVGDVWGRYITTSYTNIAAAGTYTMSFTTTNNAANGFIGVIVYTAP